MVTPLTIIVITLIIIVIIVGIKDLMDNKKQKKEIKKDIEEKGGVKSAVEHKINKGLNIQNDNKTSIRKRKIEVR